jgi:broad specificity phosphatase PhoE
MRAALSKTVFLARHGQTEWNLEGRKQGQLDSPLTPAGLAQAEQLGENLAGLGIERIVTSPLGRARKTAEIAAGRIGVEVKVIDELAEMHHGTFAGRTSTELSGDAHWRRRADDKYGWRFPQGESYADLDARAGLALKRVRELGPGPVLVVSHEMIGRMLVKNLCGLTEEAALAHKHPHGVVLRWDAVDPRALATVRS